MTGAYDVAVNTAAGLTFASRHQANIFGTRGPFVVLQHGFGTDQTAWRKVLPFLTGSYRVVTMNLAGAGPQGAQIFDAGQYDRIEAYADDFLAVMHELGIEDFTYIGASVGCMIGMLAAIARPSVFHKMIFLSGSPRYLNDTGYIGGFEQAELDGLYAAMHADYQGWITGFAPLAVRGPAQDAAVREFSASLFRYRPDIALSMARTIFQSDFRKHLGSVTTPTVLLHTNNDIAVPEQVGEYMREHLRDSKLEMLPVEGHFPHLVAPKLVAEALLRHLP